jgi:hypothetical protein
MGLKEARIWRGRCRWCRRFRWRPRRRHCWPRRSNRLGQRRIGGGNDLVFVFVIRGGSLVLPVVLGAVVDDDEAAEGAKEQQNCFPRIWELYT